MSLLKLRRGSILVEWLADGNIAISKSHTPAERLLVERADIADLEAALTELGLLVRRDAEDRAAKHLEGTP